MCGDSDFDFDTRPHIRTFNRLASSTFGGFSALLEKTKMYGSIHTSFVEVSMVSSALKGLMSSE